MDWQKFQKQCFHDDKLGLTLDYSCMDLDSGFIDRMSAPMSRAFAAMAELEAGAVANPDEGRMVGHYWLRTPALAPEPALAAEIAATVDRIETFTRKVHSGEVAGKGGRFTDLLVIGIGGSALGPQFVAQALGNPGEDRMRVHFFDNTDPDGMDLALAQIRGRLDRTLAVVISKSGGTPETRNGMLEAAQAFLGEGIEFGSQAVAITGVDSRLDRTAREEGWLERFPMWDWVGGRTSETGPVGLLPAALQGLDIRGMLAGAAAMDAKTRVADLLNNPSALLALMWYHATNGRGEKDMVILPYKDRLMLFSKYLQQLIMESLGKELDLDGNKVYQGIAVYGNKGSTDQHAYVQQLREGVNNFFATFIEVHKEREGASLEVEPGITSGDYLNAFLLGTRAALRENGRQSLTITIPAVTAETVGMLIALYERAVGLYASLVNINAYHQPGVEAGKKAAANYLRTQQRIVECLRAHSGSALSVEQICAELGDTDEETVFKVIEHLAANPSKGIVKSPGSTLFDGQYAIR